MPLSLFIAPIVTSAIVTLALIVLALKVFPKLRLLDKPEKYGLTRKPIPYGVGLILYINFIVISFIFLELNAQIIGMLIGATVLVITGFVDDFRNLRPSIRLSVHVLAALIIIFSGFEVSVISNPFGDAIQLDIWKVAITQTMQISILSALFLLVWIVGMINTVNFLDGIPGLASGITVIAGTVLFLLSTRPEFHVINQEVLALLIGAVTISAAVFWIFDFYPPKLLMGDAGSTFLGFLLAIFAIFAGGKIATAFIVMGFPIFDVLLTVIRRLTQKKSPFKGDFQHLHHDLVRAGFSKRKTILIIYTLSALFGLTALYLGSTQKLFAIILIFLIMAVLKFSLIQKSKRVQ